MSEEAPGPISADDLAKFRESVRLLGDDGTLQWNNRTAMRLLATIDGMLDAAWAEAEAALPKAGWADPMDGRWVIPSGAWAIDIRREESGDGYFEPAVEGFWATAKVEASPRPFAIRGDLGACPADALRTLAAALRQAVA